MKLASLRDGRDGRLVVVSGDLTRAADASAIAPSLRTALDDWNAADAYLAGVSMIIYANQSLRATVSSVRQTLETICMEGTSVPVEDKIASVADIFELQHLDDWREVAE